MGARTGAQYIADLKKMQREIWIGGERVDDVTTHPATRMASPRTRTSTICSTIRRSAT